ncbi:aminoglycoside nucleotidyltransferase [Actinoplanes bogorensis]|uniref:Aminoglycoside nucleotidyltransferase n=1 Tax=Paractinoplanes bogorensis TaxID=1610840 RepID=A0ABS5YP39_9ACTN|nr:aminoglycoside nucleotidyltransferase [Actinoplanes bogorensis]MBU2664504.1 aminoglycoside nucleotidyltransferase [Actinoplanes bogorensis]
MTGEDVRTIVTALTGRGVDVCLSGGWAVDALLGEQTREHSDLDVWIPAAQTAEAFEGLVAIGLDRIFPWPGDRPWNFVLHDGSRLRLDLHLYEVRADGQVHYGSALDGFVFPASALAGAGTVDGMAVRCEAPEWSVRWHSDYPARDKDRHDVPRICSRFGIPLPPQFRRPGVD